MISTKEGPVLSLHKHNGGDEELEDPRRAIHDMRHASIQTLLGTAAGVVQSLEANSTVMDRKLYDRIPKFSMSELQIGSVLGRGGFCVVKELDRIRIRHSPRDSTTPTTTTCTTVTTTTNHNSKRRSFLRLFRKTNAGTDWDLGGEQLPRGDDDKVSRDYVASTSNPTRRRGRLQLRKPPGKYVIKTVHHTGVDKITVMKGHVDMAVEANVLASLDHANIIELAGVSGTGPCTTGFFLILERMTETLSHRIKGWMDQERLASGITGLVLGNGTKKRHDLYVDRIGASYDIVSGLHYLHSKQILFRDLKPDNIGFDTNNVLKIFDFGLAKELKEADRITSTSSNNSNKNLYKNMTAMTGAVRYMAPEVAAGQPYNSGCDVYSWSMVMWYMLALEPPFGMYSEDMILDRVCRNGSRPAVFTRWNDSMGNLLRASWDPNPHVRPSCLEIALVLTQELLACDGARDGGSLATNSTK